MEVLSTIAEVRQWRHGCTGRVGFVPTMGALHAGHASLLERMRGECDHGVCSIFVNPMQFGAGEDLDRYPRTMERDLALCEAEGVDCVFAPNSAELYPGAAAPDRPQLTRVEVEFLTELLEGEARPGHFAGVATVVVKLFNIVQPHRAYFGEKDYQQLCVVRRFVADLNFPVQIVACPTVREADGLALSSRNAYLSPAERRAAPRLYEALLAVRQAYLGGEREASRLAASGATLLAAAPVPLRLDYLALADPANLRPIEQARDDTRVLIAARFVSPPGSGTRLIDNIALVEPASQYPAHQPQPAVELAGVQA